MAAAGYAKLYAQAHLANASPNMINPASLRTLLEPFGELRPQPASDWTGADPLPEDIARFYAHVGPWGPVIYENIGPIGSTLNCGGNPVCIPPLHKLENLQEGYAWGSNPAGKFDDWNPDWLVIAEQGGDAFIYEKPSGHILFAFHGMGTWEPRLFANDLLTAVAALAAVANVYTSLEESEFVDCAVTEAALEKIKARLAAVIGNRAEAERMLAVLEYY
jgi:hypothetical protein